MLTLSRREEQRVVIEVPAGPARRIEVMLTDIRGREVRLGFTGDADVRFLRGELEGKRGGT